MKTKKGSKAYKAKLSTAQKRSWAKRRREAKLAFEEVPKQQWHEGTSSHRWSAEAGCQQSNIPKEEFDVIKWVNEADSPKERALRKSAMHGALYSGAGTDSKGSLLRIAERIKQNIAETEARKEQLAGEGIPYVKPGDWRLDNTRKDPNPKTLMGDQKVPVLSVIPPASIIAQGTAMRYGAYLAPRTDGKRGYGPYNWRDQPIEAHIYIDAAMRHLMQWFDGDEQETVRDDEGRVIDEVSHLAFALATIGILLDAKANSTLIDDRPRVRQMAASNLLAAHKMPRYTK